MSVLYLNFPHFLHGYWEHHFLSCIFSRHLCLYSFKCCIRLKPQFLNNSQWSQMLTSVLHLFSKKPMDVTRETPMALALIFFFDLTLSYLNVSVAWVAVRYVNSAPCRWCYYYPLQNAMIHGFLIHQTSPTCIASVQPGMRLTLHHFRKKKTHWEETPQSSFFFHRGDNRTMTRACLVMHRCPRSICLLQVHHLTLNIRSRNPLFSCSVAFFFPPTSVDLNSGSVSFLQHC